MKLFSGLMGMVICSNLVWAGLAERLGYDEQAKILIIHADDAGMCHSVNQATLTAMKEGAVTSAAAMVPPAWFPEMASWARANPELDLGLHLTLTSEWKHYRWQPVADPSLVPGLIDEEGFMWRSVAEVVANATPAEIETEIRAQIDRAIAFGINPTHVDTHMGTLFATPEFLSIYLKTAMDYGIPPMMPDPNAPQVKQLMAARGLQYPETLLDRLVALGIPLLDSLNTGEEGDTYQERKTTYHEAIRGLQPGVTEIIVHLSGEDQEIRHISNSWQARNHEFLIFTDSDTIALIESLGIHLIGWQEIKDLIQK